VAKVVPFQSSLFDLPAVEVIEQHFPNGHPPAASLPPDSSARREALDIRRSFIVEAPAGSGKTGLLVQRMLKLLADESVTLPEQVLAITFTTKATTEMRDRVLGHLEAARNNPPLPSDSSEFSRETRNLALSVLERDAQLGWMLLDQPQRLNIRTIDSVCAEIARSLPVLSGSGGHLAPTNDAKLLYREAARRTLLLLGTDAAGVPFQAALRDILLHRDTNLADCEALLADMLGLREQWGNLIPLADADLDDQWLDTHVLPRLQRALEDAICAALSEVARVFPSHLLNELADLASELGHAPPHKSVEESPIAVCAGIRTPPGAAAANLDQWKALIHLLFTKDDLRKPGGLAANHLKFDYDKKHPNHHRLCAVLEALGERPDLVPVLKSIRMLPAAQYPPHQWAMAKSLFRVLSRALLELQLVFSETGQCDFTELMLVARAALLTETGPEDLASALGAKLQHLLADEMQDTSASQYDLIRLLTASWDGHSQTVFLVGDPRQSIYMFRQARVDSFLETMHTRRLGEITLTPLRLTANFRSQPELVSHFNADFELVFPDVAGENAEALPYKPVDFIRLPSPHGAGRRWQVNPVEIRPPVLLPGVALSPAQLRQKQARADAREMRSIVQRWFNTQPPPGRTDPWRIAVLVRNRTHLQEVVAEFDSTERGRILYKAVEITPLAERQEILDLSSLTRLLLHPGDRVAGFAVLRAPWCGLSLADLHTLAGEDSSDFRRHSIQRLLQDRGHLLPDESIQRMTRVWKVLEAAASRHSRCSTAQRVEQAWRSLGGDAWLTESELTNARRFFQLLDEIESEAGASGQIDPLRLMDRMDRLYAEPATIPPGEPFVELLTIHRAKGLEWDVVLVPALERGGNSGGSRLLTWSELSAADSSDSSSASPVLLAPIAAKGNDVEPLTAWLKDIYKRREAAERKRLFYVAATRAREELHLFAAPDLTQRGNLNPRYDSLLKAAWDAAEPHFPAESHPAAPALAAALADEIDEPEQFDLAASAEPSPTIAAPPPIVQRLPSSFDPAQRFAEARTHRIPIRERDDTADASAAKFGRPEGSLAARSFGNAVHAWMEILSQRFAEGQTAADLLHELPSWKSRIGAILRADGHARAVVQDLTLDTIRALENVLRDPIGLWLLQPHKNAASEYAVTTWNSANERGESPASVRADRIFCAGSEPQAGGEDSLWIIDYKTAGHGSKGVDTFLESQRETYGPQLETYARLLAPTQGVSIAQVRLGLYFPVIPRLTWWPAR
jgi:ATP-dependent helicase/nuclease subunit A